MSDGQQSPFVDDREADAVFSDDREYRYRLWRKWNGDEPAVVFILLNPSTADEQDDDQTIRRLKGFAKDWGFGKLIVGNLFAKTATKPEEMKDHPNPVGPENHRHLREICDEAQLVVAGWGVHGDFMDREAEFLKTAESWGVDLFALDTTKDGHPRHPLFVPADTDIQPFPDGDNHDDR